jgi:hypothetical protein
MAQVQDWEMAKKHGRVVAKAWADAGFKERLLADPATVLREHGFEDDEAIRFVMPAPPSGEFGDEALGGDGMHAAGCGPCGPNCFSGFSGGGPCFCPPSSGGSCAPPVQAVERALKHT